MPEVSTSKVGFREFERSDKGISEKSQARSTFCVLCCAIHGKAHVVVGKHAERKRREAGMLSPVVDVMLRTVYFSNTNSSSWTASKSLTPVCRISRPYSIDSAKRPALRKVMFMQVLYCQV